MAGFLDSKSSFHGGVKIGLTHELAADDYYRAKQLAQAKAKAKPKAKTKGKAKAEPGAREKGKDAVKKTVKSKVQAPDPSQEKLEKQRTLQESVSAGKSQESSSPGAEEAESTTLPQESVAADDVSGDPGPPPPVAASAEEDVAIALIATEPSLKQNPARCRQQATEAVCLRGGCSMVWTRQAKYLDYSCADCGGSLRGARWHCAAHAEDLCSRCCSAPPEAAFSGGGGDIDDDSWRRRLKPQVGSAQESESDLLGDMLAAQEDVIRRRRLDDMEADELRETLRPSPKEVSSRCNGSDTAAPTTAAGTLLEHDGVFEEREPDERESNTAGLMDEDAARIRPKWAEMGQAPLKCAGTDQPLERTCELTLVLLGDFLDELARGYGQAWFQDLVRQCAYNCNYDRAPFLAQLQDIAFEVQRPILENWGFEGNLQGLYDMTSIIREHSAGNDMPDWLKERRDNCLTLLYGGQLGGMLSRSAAGAAQAK